MTDPFILITKDSINFSIVYNFTTPAESPTAMYFLECVIAFILLS